MMNKLLLSLAFALFIVSINIVKANDALLPIEGMSCQSISSSSTRLEARNEAYNKVLLLAVKNSSYLKEVSVDYDDYSFDIISYKVLDNALKDINITTITDDDKKICLELNGFLDGMIIDDILLTESKLETPVKNIEEIAENVNTTLPKSIYEMDVLSPLLFVMDVEFYNNTSTSSFNNYIVDILQKEPNILITDNYELADYIVYFQLTESKIEKIDDENSEYSIAMLVEIRKQDESIFASKIANNKINIKNSDNYQKLANDLSLNMIESMLASLSSELKTMQSDLVI